MRAFFAAGIAIAAALAAGVAYQQWGLRRDHRRWPAPGKLVDAGDGTLLHVFELGEGDPAVVLESGIAATTLNWRALQRRVARFTRVISYDRAGLGFSGSADVPRTPARIAGQLHALLEKSNVAPPYVVVGHSFGGLVVRSFAAHYPAHTAAVVLLDPLCPEDWTPLSESQRTMLRRGVMLSNRGAALARFGVVRLCLAALLRGSRFLPAAIGRVASGNGMSVMNRIAGEIGKMPREVWPVIAANWSDARAFAGLTAHLRDLAAGIAETSGLATLSGVPVTVITGRTDGNAATACIRAISPEATHLVAPNSGHWIHLDEPELVERVIRDAVESIRAVSGNEPRAWKR